MQPASTTCNWNWNCQGWLTAFGSTLSGTLLEKKKRAPKHYKNWHELYEILKNKITHFTEYQNIYIYILLLRSSWFLNTFQHPCYPSVGKCAKTWTLDPLIPSLVLFDSAHATVLLHRIANTIVTTEWMVFFLTKYYGGWHCSVGFNKQNTGIFRHFLWRYNRDTNFGYDGGMMGITIDIYRWCPSSGEFVSYLGEIYGPRVDSR